MQTADISLEDLLAIVDIDKPTPTTDKITVEQLRDFILGFVTTQINVSQTVFVDPIFGDDFSGLRERQDKPFATIAAAVASAVAGDTIVLRAGDHYVFTSIVKDGVSFYGEEGSNIYSFTNFPLLNFDTTGGGVALSTPFYWTGYSEILYSSGPLIAVRSNPTADITLEFNSVQVNNISNGIIGLDGLIKLLVRGNYTCAGRNFSMRLTGNLIAEIWGVCTNTFVGTFNGVFWISGTAWTGKANIKAKSFAIPTNAVGGFSCHIYADNLSGSQLTIELDELIDTSNVAQSAIRINNAFANTSGDFYIKIKKVSTVRPLYANTNSVSNVILQVDEVVATGSSNHVAGKLLIKNSLIKSSINIPLYVTGGLVSLMSTTIVTDGINTTIQNNAGTVLSEGSKGNVAPVNPVVGNFYVNALYTN